MGRLFVASRPDLTLTAAKNLVIRALMARSECNERGLAYDVFFRDRDTAEAYAAAVKLMRNAMSSDDARSPLKLFALTSELGVDPSKVSDPDFVNIRENDEAFAIWRRIAKEILDRVTSGDFNDTEKELNDYVKEQQARWRAEVVSALGGDFWASVLDKSVEAAIGGALGSLAGHYVDNRWYVSGALSGAAKPLVGIIGAASKAVQNGPARASFNHHYIAVTKRDLNV